VAALVAAWLAVRPFETHEIDAIAWLEARPEMRQLKAALRAQLIHLWADAYKSGIGDASLPDQAVQDQVNQQSATWLNQVTQTRVQQIAAILAAGGTAAAIAAAILAVLRSASAALKIAVTETFRALNAGALAAYRRSGVGMVRWVTRSGHPCPVCVANEAEGSIHVGAVFQSGDQAPPAHPNCECVLVPAEG
jgi:hypothetical protein